MIQSNWMPSEAHSRAYTQGLKDIQDATLDMLKGMHRLEKKDQSQRHAESMEWPMPPRIERSEVDRNAARLERKREKNRKKKRKQRERANAQRQRERAAGQRANGR